MNEMLTGVIDHGTGRSAALPRPAAGKTGTTQDYRDAWFIGYTADLVAGVWLGNDDNTPMNKVTGGSLPAQAWRSFMLAATRGMPVRPLPSGPSRAGGNGRRRRPAAACSTISLGCSDRAPDHGPRRVAFTAPRRRPETLSRTAGEGTRTSGLSGSSR